MFFVPRSVESEKNTNGITGDSSDFSPSPQKAPRGSGGSVGHQSFGAYTERSAPSLDQQPNPVEHATEVEMCGLIEGLLGRLSNVEEIELARENVETQPKLEINPYRPPRGSHLRGQIQDMQVVEWGGLDGCGLSLRGETMPIRAGEQRALSRHNSNQQLHGHHSPDRATLHIESDVAPFTFETRDADQILSVRGVAASKAPANAGPIAKVSAYGGIEEETIATHGSGSEEESLGLGVCGTPVTAEEEHRAAKRQELGMPPISPRACAAEEASHLVFQRVWDQVVVPHVVSVLQPKQPAVPVVQPEPANSREGRSRHSTADGAKKRSASARRFVSMYVEEQHTLREKEGDNLERVPTPNISKSPATPNNTGSASGAVRTATDTSANVPVPLPLNGRQATSRRLSVPSHSDTDDEDRDGARVVASNSSAREGSIDGELHNSSSGRTPYRRQYVRAATAKPTVKPRLIGQ